MKFKARHVTLLWFLAALICAVGLSSCDGDKSSTTESAQTEVAPPQQEPCVIGAAALGLVVRAVRRGRDSFEGVDAFVNSKLGGDAIGAGCVEVIDAFLNQRTEPVSLDIELPEGVWSATVSLDELLSPPPQAGSEWLGCYDYSTEFEQSLCLRKLIPLP